MRQNRVERSFKKNLLWAAVAATISGGVVSVEAAGAKTPAEVPESTGSNVVVIEPSKSSSSGDIKKKTTGNGDVRIQNFTNLAGVGELTTLSGFAGGDANKGLVVNPEDKIIQSGSDYLELKDVKAGIAPATSSTSHRTLQSISRSPRALAAEGAADGGGTLDPGGTLKVSSDIHVDRIGDVGAYQTVDLSEKHVLRVNAVSAQHVILKGEATGFDLTGAEPDYLRPMVLSSTGEVQYVDSKNRTAKKEGEQWFINDEAGKRVKVKFENLTPVMTHVEVDGNQLAILAIADDRRYDLLSLKGPDDGSAAEVPVFVVRTVETGNLKEITVQNRSLVTVVDGDDNAYRSVNALSLDGRGFTFGIDGRKLPTDGSDNLGEDWFQPATFKLLQADQTHKGKPVAVTVGKGHVAYLHLEKDEAESEHNKYAVTVDGFLQGAFVDHDGFTVNRGGMVGGTIHSQATEAGKGTVFNDGARYFGDAVTLDGSTADKAIIAGATDYYGTVRFAELTQQEMDGFNEASTKLSAAFKPKQEEGADDSVRSVSETAAVATASESVPFVVTLTQGPHTVHGRLVVVEGDNPDPVTTVQLAEADADHTNTLTFKKGATLAVMLDESNNSDLATPTALFDVPESTKIVAEEGAKFAALAPAITIIDGQVVPNTRYSQVANLMTGEQVERALVSVGEVNRIDIKGKSGLDNTGSVFFDTTFAGEEAVNPYVFTVSAAKDVKSNLKAQGLQASSVAVLGAQTEKVLAAFKAVPVPAAALTSGAVEDDDEDDDEDDGASESRTNSATISLTDAKLYNALQAAELEGRLAQRATESTFQSVVNGAGARQVVELLRAAHSKAILARMEHQSAGSAWGSQGMIAAGDGDGDRGVWGQYIFSDGDQSSKDGFSGYSLKMNGITVGVDAMANDMFTVGAAFTYAKTDVDAKDVSQSTKGDNYAVSLYGGWAEDNWFANGALSYAWSDNDYKSQVTGDGEYKGDGKAKGWGLTLGGGYNMALDAQWLLQPKVEFNYYDVKVDDFDLKGANAAKWKTDNVQVIELGAGIRVLGDIDLEEGKLTPEFRLMGYYDFKDNNYGGEYALVGGPTASITGLKREQGRGVAGLGLGFAMDNGLSMGLDYDYNFSGDYKAHSIKANLSYAF